MFLLITYDVNLSSLDGEKRLRKVAKLCMNYGHRVQNSVFECSLTESQFLLLKNCLLEIINKETDSIRFYTLSGNWKQKVETIGKNKGIDFSGELII